MPHLVGAMVVLVLLGTERTAAQPDISWGALTYLDFAQPLHSHDEDPYGEFSLRRLYLTADATFGSSFSGRARLEANSGAISERGAPTPFVKDLFVRWRALSGHRLSLGIQSPPAFQIAEAVWGYRSLARTVTNASGAVSSRDFGLAASGPIAGDLSYGLMVGNNEGVRVENDKFKRVYGQIRWMPERFAFSFHTDYAAYGDDREDAVTFSAFAGVSTDRYRVGAEGVWRHTWLATEEEDLRGVGVFAVVVLASRFDLVLRSHWKELVSTVTPPPEDRDSPRGPVYFLGAISYEATDGLHLIPNVYWEEPDEGGEVVVARFTLSASL